VLPSREALAHDPHRPRYHFLPPANWMNDPNGLIHWQGRYHLFYQYNPFEAVWGSMHWGHAESSDLVHWTDLPIALAPGPGEADKDHVFSGCAVDGDGVPTLIYTGVRVEADGSRREVPCLATSSDGLMTWHKHAGNPIIPGPPPGLDVLGFRDHSVWKDGQTWYQLIGSGIPGVGGTALLYRSADLRSWEYVHPLCIGVASETGEMWECPDFFKLGDQHVLIVSPIPLRKSLYFVGSYREQRFEPRSQGVIDDGGCFYAPQSFTDAQGRRIMFGWLWEGRSENAQRAAGWAGVMSLPRVLSAMPDGRLAMQPAAELETLRRQHSRLTNLTLEPSDTRVLEPAGKALEINASIRIDAAEQVALKVRCSPDGAEQTAIEYDGRSLVVNRERASLDPDTDRDRHATALALGPGEPLRLRVFVDRSVVEVFANDVSCITTRIYPTRPDSLGVEILAIGGQACLETLDVWEMASIW